MSGRNPRDALIGIIGGIADVDAVLDHLKRAGWSIVDTLGHNQCGECQHWSWEHKGPIHPCELCDCERYKRADPDRVDENITGPE